MESSATSAWPGAPKRAGSSPSCCRFSTLLSKPLPCWVKRKISPVASAFNMTSRYNSFGAAGFPGRLAGPGSAPDTAAPDKAVSAASATLLTLPTLAVLAAGAMAASSAIEQACQVSDHFMV
ncbi:hypothetical protein D3C81_770170 [compost metagenome]